MPIAEKIHRTRYVLLSVVPLHIGFYFSDQTVVHYLVLLFVSVCVAANHALLAEGFKQQIDQVVNDAEGEKKSKKIAKLFITKFAILGVGLVLAIQFMPGLIIIPVLIYIAQLGVLALSLKRD